MEAAPVLLVFVSLCGGAFHVQYMVLDNNLQDLKIFSFLCYGHFFYTLAHVKYFSWVLEVKKIAETLK